LTKGEGDHLILRQAQHEVVSVVFDPGETGLNLQIRAIGLI